MTLKLAMDNEPDRNPVAHENPMRGLIVGAALAIGLIAVIVGLAFLLTGCASEDPRSAYVFVTNSIQRAATQLEKTLERDSVQADPATAETAAEDPAAAEAAATAAGPRLVFRFGGFRGGNASEDPTVQIKDFRFSATGMSYAWSKGDLGAWGLARTDAGALACAFYWSEKERAWIGGKFDWISTSRLTRSWTNIRGGYGGWPAEEFFWAERHAFCIVSSDGRRRTNLITD